MSLPVQSVRANPEHRDILQAVAELLRRGGEGAIRRWLAEGGGEPCGPFRSEAAALGFIRDRLVASLHPRMVWLFGSRARGDARPDSDFDILVVLPDDLPERAYGHEAVAEPLVASGLAYDVVPARWSEFLTAREQPGTLAHKAVREGRLLYQDPALRRKARAAA